MKVILQAENERERKLLGKEREEIPEVHQMAVVLIQGGAIAGIYRRNLVSDANLLVALLEASKEDIREFNAKVKDRS